MIIFIFDLFFVKLYDVPFR